MGIPSLDQCRYQKTENVVGKSLTECAGTSGKIDILMKKKQNISINLMIVSVTNFSTKMKLIHFHKNSVQNF